MNIIREAEEILKQPETEFEKAISLIDRCIQQLVELKVSLIIKHEKDTR